MTICLPGKDKSKLSFASLLFCTAAAELILLNERLLQLANKRLFPLRYMEPTG
jgi:hypothetical protein